MNLIWKLSSQKDSRLLKEFNKFGSNKKINTNSGSVSFRVIVEILKLETSSIDNSFSPGFDDVIYQAPH